MPSEFVIAVLAGLGGMFGWGLADLFAKKTIDEIGDLVTLVWAHIFGAIAFFGIAIYQLWATGEFILIPTDIDVWLLLILFGVLQAAVYLFAYKGFAKGQVAVLNPVFASFAGITAIMSILFFGEIVSGSLVVALMIIFAGVILLNIDLDALKRRKFDVIHVPGFRQVILATFLAAFWTLFWDKFVSGQDWLSFAVFMYLFMTIAMIIFAWTQKVKLKITKPTMWKFLVFIGLFEVVAYTAISLGYSLTTMTSVVAMLSGAFSLPTIILAHSFLKERTTTTQKIGGGVIIAGIVLLALF